MMADLLMDRPRTVMTKARARRFVITLRLKASKRAKKVSRNSVPSIQPLLPRWEEMCFEVAIVSRRK